MKKLLVSFIILGFVASTSAQQAPKVSPVVKATATATGQKLQYPQTDKPEIESVLIEIAPGERVDGTCIRFPPTCTFWKAR